MAAQNLYSDEDQALIALGYQPQLQRSLCGFSSFAVAFSAMSVLMGIFANFGFALGKAGPFGFWAWPIVGCGQFLVALVFAELAGRIPLTGAIYNWNSRLANKSIGWLSAWMLMVTYILSSVGVLFAMIAPIQTLIGRDLDPSAARFIGVGIIIAQVLINIYGVRLASHANKIAVIAEIAAIFGFGILLLTKLFIDHSAHIDYLIRVPSQPQPYWHGFIMASLLAAWTLLGFEFSSDLSEETHGARRVTPKAILSAVILSACIGSFLLLVLALAIPDIVQVSASSDPLSAIFAYYFGPAVADIFLVVALIAMFAVTLMVLAGTSRVLFAIARDGLIPASSALSKVSARKIPIAATITVAIMQIGIFMVAQNATDMFTASTIIYYVVYLITAVSFAVGTGKLPPPQNFSLGRWRKPVVVAAILWLTAEIGVLTIPADFHAAALIAAAIILLGLSIHACGQAFKRTTAKD